MLFLGFFGTTSDAAGQSFIQSIMSHRDFFDDDTICFFGVSVDPSDEHEGRVQASLPGIRFLWDFDGKVSSLYGASAKEQNPQDAESLTIRRQWVVLDPMLRVLKVILSTSNNTDHSALFEYLQQLPPVNSFSGIEIQAPILILPNVFEPDFCRQLIDLHVKNGGELSGFMRERDGKTIKVIDHNFKSRKDYTIKDADIISKTQAIMLRRVVPEMQKAYCFKATKMERYIVSCYSSEEDGHFNAHRDNTTKGTAHRRFAVSINLNNDFDGGEISFPEFNSRSYKAPIGSAVIFSCSLLHQVSQVTHGQRYVFLPFLYDDEASIAREKNNQFLDDDIGHYKSTT